MNRTLVGETYEDLVFKKWWPGGCFVSGQLEDVNKLECDSVGGDYGMGDGNIEEQNLPFGIYRVKKSGSEIIFEVDSDCNQTILKGDNWNWQLQCSAGQQDVYPDFETGPGHTCTCWTFDDGSSDG